MAECVLCCGRREDVNRPCWWVSFLIHHGFPAASIVHKLRWADSFPSLLPSQVVFPKPAFLRKKKHWLPPLHDVVILHVGQASANKMASFPPQPHSRFCTWSQKLGCTGMVCMDIHGHFWWPKLHHKDSARTVVEHGWLKFTLGLRVLVSPVTIRHEF